MQRDAFRVELFPFMAVLMCFLGGLLTIGLTVVALSVLFPQEIWSLGMPGKAHRLPAVIEWDGFGVTIHPQRVVIPAAVALEKDGDNSSEFGQLLREVRAHPDKRFLFVLVRPTGFSTFPQLLQMLQQDEVDVGYEAAVPEQKISIVISEGATGVP